MGEAPVGLSERAGRVVGLLLGGFCKGFVFASGAIVAAWVFGLWS